MPEAPRQDDKAPLVTFALFAYNQERYVEEAIKAALSQTYGNLEIIISDDCSTDATLETIQTTVGRYKGPHALIVRQNKTNIGLADHINTVMALAKGELIVAAAGDDMSFPHRVTSIVDHWLRSGRESGSIFSRFQTIDETGHITRHQNSRPTQRFSLSGRDLESTLGISNGTSGCAHAWTRDVFEIFGPINPRILHEDITLPLRSLLIGSVTYLPDELVLYRITRGSLSRASFSNYRERFTKMARYWDGRVANYEQYERDSTRIAGRNPLNPADLDWLNRIVRTQADLAKLNYRFFSGNFRDQMRAIFDNSIRASVARRLKLLILALLPPLYGLKAKF
jgi:glycosyltransferase involved in cell wall biosynthesis